MKTLKEKVMYVIFLLSSCMSVLAAAIICVFLFANGIPAIQKIGIGNFLLGTKWKPGNDIYGIFPMILGSLLVTSGAILIGVPIGILTAVYLAKFCPKKFYRILRSAVDLLSEIPSVVYGFFGMVVLVSIMAKLFGGSGKNMVTASILLGIMIFPTIVGVSEAAVRAVPESYYEGALALGATHEYSVFFTILPAARSGILASVILGVGRAVGETMAVIMVAGNQARIPNSVFSGVRTMTANIVLEMGYAADLHREALIATAVVLFVFILMINLCFSVISRKGIR